jgi:hypothetical protein
VNSQHLTSIMLVRVCKNGAIVIDMATNASSRIRFGFTGLDKVSSAIYVDVPHSIFARLLSNPDTLGEKNDAVQVSPRPNGMRLAFSTEEMNAQRKAYERRGEARYAQLFQEAQVRSFMRLIGTLHIVTAPEERDPMLDFFPALKPSRLHLPSQARLTLSGKTDIDELPHVANEYYRQTAAALGYRSTGSRVELVTFAEDQRHVSVITTRQPTMSGLVPVRQEIEAGGHITTDFLAIRQTQHTQQAVCLAALAGIAETQRSLM